MSKKSGIANVTVSVIVSSNEAVTKFKNDFYRSSRVSGTVTIHAMKVVEAGGHDKIIICRYSHECVNQGASVSDARKAIVRAMLTHGDVDYSFEHQVIRTKWEPIV